MANETDLNMDVDALLDGTLDDLADIPEFKLYPPGVHKCTINFAMKGIKDPKKIDACEVKLTGIETIELPSGSSDEPISKGQVAQVLCILKHENPTAAEFGQGLFKIIMAALAKKFGNKSNRELMEEGQNAEVAVVTGIRKSKGKNGNPDRENVQLIEIEVV